MRTLLSVLAILFAPAVVGTANAEEEIRAAVVKGLRRLEEGSGNYVKNRQCFSCHHQSLTIAALTAAKKRGFRIDEERLQQQIAFTRDSFQKKDQLIKGQGVGGANTTVAYALFTLEAAGQPGDETTAALIEFLLVRQKEDGSWPATTRRPPTEGSLFTNNALALHALKTYRPTPDGKDADALRQRVDAAFARGRAWLLKNKPEDTEDKAFRLRALVTAAADAREIENARDLLLKEQQEDGSWAQLADRPGDAYATSLVLMALREAGVSPDAPAFQKGVKYLLKTQRSDGGWVVETRSRPVQIFFDNGDPGGKSQFLSFMTTGWAIRALLETIPVEKP
jgi:N-acyl-D-amino-acid deacylase